MRYFVYQMPNSFLNNALIGVEDMTKLIISRIEKNQRHVCDAELRILAKALGVTIEWLVGDADEQDYGQR